MAHQSRLESIQLRQAAVAKEDETAVYMLGAAYANGRVRVPVDLERAVELWAASSAHGCALDGSPDKQTWKMFASGENSAIEIPHGPYR